VDALSLDHLALAVKDQERSASFYSKYFGFAPEAEPREDGTVMLHNDGGFSLALGIAEEQPSMPGFFHFGFSAGSPENVRTMRDRLRGDGIGLVGEWEEENYVSIKFPDPDGYVIEYSWEVLPT
jgi:glyoxylase I family protein